MASVSHSMATTTSVLSALSEETAMLSNIMLANDDDLAIALGTSQIRGCRLVAYILLTTIRVIAQEKSKDPIKWRVLSNNDGKLFLIAGPAELLLKSVVCGTAIRTAICPGPGTVIGSAVGVWWSRRCNRRKTRRRNSCKATL